MKILLVSLIIIILVITCSVLIYYYIENTSNNYSTEITSITDDIRKDNWSEAEKKLEIFNEKWEFTVKLWKLVIEHEELDNIEKSLVKSQQFIINKNKVFSLTELSTLIFYLEHVYIKEKVNMQNVF